MSESLRFPATTWKFQVVPREVPGQPNMEAGVLEERIGENVMHILEG